MKTETSGFSLENKLDLSWGRPFFVCASVVGLYYIAYLALLLHIIAKSGAHFF